MPTNTVDGNGGRQEHARRSLVEQLLDPFGVVMLTRERIQDTLEDAVRRGRVTRRDANELAGVLVRRGRQQTDELLSEIERLLGSTGDGGRSGRLTEGVTRLARTADRARRTVTGTQTVPIEDYDALTARQVQAHLGELGPGELRALDEYERRHANRKTVLDAIERALA
jgi:polyhydroxyalkanoate synthesis regulator phasin